MRTDYFMSMQRNLKVSILGKSYCISTDENETDVVYAAELVDQLMQNRAEKKSLSEEQVALSVALEIAINVKKQERILQQQKQEADRLITLLEQAL